MSCLALACLAVVLTCPSAGVRGNGPQFPSEARAHDTAQDSMRAAVSTGNVAEPNAADLVREQKIPFPVGKADADLRKMRQTWGIRSFPWLILADEEHIVRAEGFGPGDIEAVLVETEEMRK